MKIKRALISVSDKTGVVEFAKFLSDNGIEIISTGGTMKTISDAGIKVTYVSDVTGFPEIMDGRVKTLNPFVHGGILAIRDNAEHVAQMQEHNIKPIDIVAVNLYPFKQTIAKADVTEDQAIENIDIGGPAMIRAAAKNFKYTTVIVNPSDYITVMDALKKGGDISLTTRRSLAQKAYSHTCQYDGAISAYLEKALHPDVEYPQEKAIFLTKIEDLRYGENPHQSAAFYRIEGDDGGIASAKQLHGKELSFNNIVDIEAAYRIVCEFSQPAATIIKHTNPCGTAVASTICAAYVKAYEADSVSAFGGIIGLNRIVDKASAEHISELFAEAVIAPGYQKEALEILQKKKNVRLLELPLLDLHDNLDMKKVTGGMLLQRLDTDFADKGDLKVVTKLQPNFEQLEQLIFAMRIVKHVKSNAIVLARNFQSIGIGAGQMNRVGSAKIALEQAGDMTRGAVLASDAFLPFADTVEEAARAGVIAIIQPGGSVRDQESIDMADKHGIAMILTGMRHFKH